jgi:hypothetical protein
MTVCVLSAFPASSSGKKEVAVTITGAMQMHAAIAAICIFSKAFMTAP